ncbi:LytR/AlgR family response regulator transcription factor [Pedobacter sp. AW31-3R]|uniref:LytR/AlgR family response regulator transcription factor n=1 Tax=Pedobacter sp. AW31-3R TaxID=3445781 RepID=UPI003F9EFC52
MTSLSAIYVDDEMPALELIKNYCSSIPELRLLACFRQAAEALEFIKKNDVDLLILDIQMPEISGVDMVKMIPPGKLIIFITADPGHAAQAYELDVIDYLVKPVFPERFLKAVQKAVDYQKYLESSNLQDYIIFKSDYMVNKLPIDEIHWIEGCGEYLKIVTRFKQYMVLQRLNDFLEKHDQFGFIRIHKSYIVLKDHIESRNSQWAILKNGKQLPIGRTYKDTFS